MDVLARTTSWGFTCIFPNIQAHVGWTGIARYIGSKLLQVQLSYNLIWSQSVTHLAAQSGTRNQNNGSGESTGSFSTWQIASELLNMLSLRRWLPQALVLPVGLCWELVGTLQCVFPPPAGRTVGCAGSHRGRRISWLIVSRAKNAALKGRSRNYSVTRLAQRNRMSV